MNKNSWTGGETLSYELSLDDLAIAVHQRTDGAFERLVDSFEKPLFNYAQRLLRNVQDAQEVVQDTFVRAHKALTHQYSAEKCQDLALRPWLFRIARNLSHNKRRGKRHELEQQFPESESVRLDPKANPISIICRIEQKQELERLDEAISLLPEESRELLVLRFIEEMSYGEIAQTIGQGEAALRGKVFRALRQLRSILDEKGVPYAM